jgi:hypothetical protein
MHLLLDCNMYYTWLVRGWVTARSPNHVDDGMASRLSGHQDWHALRAIGAQFIDSTKAGAMYARTDVQTRTTHAYTAS